MATKKKAQRKPFVITRGYRSGVHAGYLVEDPMSNSIFSAPKASPVNRFSPNPDSCANLTAPNWERLKIDVRERIDALAAIMSDRCNAPPELKAKLYTDLVLPNIRLLSEFCANVTFDDDDREPLTDNTGCDS